MAKNKPHIDVMISSTSKDLPEHREQVRNAALRMGMFPVAMEYLGAMSGADAISASLDMVDKAEIYVGIFGMRYGYVPDDPRNSDKISITEMEYRRAVERDIPILIYVMDKTHPLTVDDIETNVESKKKLEAFKAHLTGKHIVGFFKSPEELRSLVIQGLAQEAIRAGELAGEHERETVKEPKLPQPPELYASPTYTLTTEFIGRNNELRLIDEWATSDDPVMIVEAIGGMGKSAVTWQWVQTRSQDVFEPDGIIWWSFYERGATMKSFVRHALAYVTRKDPDDYKGQDLQEMFKQLQTALSKGCYLLVLDGMERVLVAYHRWNAAQMRDDTIEEAESIIKDRDLRTCTDPKDDAILQGLLACTSTKTLISSRLLPLALENRGGALSKGVRHIHLNGLHEDDALTLVQSQGVTVSDVRQFKTFMKGFDFHSLLVMLVAGRVNKFRRRRGDFDAWYDYEGKDITVSDFDVRQSQTHVLKYAFEGLTPEQDLFLSQIAAFGDAIEYDTMEVFNPFLKPAPEPVGNPEDAPSAISVLFENDPIKKAELQKQIDDAKREDAQERYEQYLKDVEEHQVYFKSKDYREAQVQFDELLEELEQRGLLRWDREKNRYDMHPVVRGYAFDRLGGENKTGTFERIENHFKAQPDENADKAESVADLANTIAIYRALLGAGKLDVAAGFYNSRLKSRLHYNIAAYYTIIELLTPLFGDGVDTLPTLESKSLQSAIATTLGSILSYIGRNEEGLALFSLNLKLDLDEDEASHLCVGLLNYANSLKSDNQPALSQRAQELSLSLAEAIEDGTQIAYSRLALLGSYKDTGQWQELEEIYQLLQENPPREVYWQAVVEKYYTESLIMRGQEAESALNKAEKLSLQGRNALIYRQIQGLRGEAALQKGDIDKAIRYFEDCLQLYRKSGSSHTAWVLGGLARTYAQQGNHDRARQIIEENDFDDDQIDVAEVYLAIGETDKAREVATNAYKYYWADGHPYVWWWYLERAKTVLDGLGEPYPDMPPYDESKIGKLPHEDEIRAYIRKKGGEA